MHRITNYVYLISIDTFTYTLIIWFSKHRCSRYLISALVLIQTIHPKILVISDLLCYTLVVFVVKGDLCSEYLDGCDPQCQTRCETKHPDGQSSCDANTSLCKCYYQCGQPVAPPQPPKGKMCNVGIGPCSQRCNEQCCNAKCADKFPGDYEGYGICYSPGPSIYNACLCYFRCKN